MSAGDLALRLSGSTFADKTAFAQLAEERGYHSVWQPEGRGGDQFSILTACALGTRRIGLGTSISSVFVRTAPLIGMAAATVDRYSGGRMTLGLGTDHRGQVERMYGHTYERPIQRLRETVDIVRALWRDGEVAYAGDIFDIERFDMWLEPGRTAIPVHVAAVNPKMLAVAGEIGDGVIVTNHTVDSMRHVRAHIDAGAAAAGKSAGDVTVSALIGCAVADDRDEARACMRYELTAIRTRNDRYARLKRDLGFGDDWERLLQTLDTEGRAAAAATVSDAYLDAFTLAGTPTEVRDRLERWREAGVDLPILLPAGSRADQLAVVRALAPAGTS